MPGVLSSEMRTGIYASIASANKYIRGSHNPMIKFRIELRYSARIVKGDIR